MSEPHNVDEPEQRIWDRYWRENSLPDEDEARAKVHYFAGYAARMNVVNGDRVDPDWVLSTLRVGGMRVWTTANWRDEPWDILRDGEHMQVSAAELHVGDKIPCDKDEEGNHRWQEISGIDEIVPAPA